MRRFIESQLATAEGDPRRKSAWNAYAYLIPALVVTALTTLIPTLYTVYLSFTNWSLFHFKDHQWVGMKNYAEIFASAEAAVFVRVFAWTLAWSALSVAGSLMVGMAFALLLNRKSLGGRYFYRTLLIVPWAMPSFITVLMWGGLMDGEFGALNTTLRALGLAGVPWLTDPGWARASVVLVNIWLSFPFMMSTLLGALQSIPAELYEAADMDGSTAMYSFRRITLPMLRSAILPVVITSFAFAFNNFVGIYLLTQGGPPLGGESQAGATDILISYTFKLGFDLSRYGLASAYAVVIFMMIGSLSLVNARLTGAFADD